MKPLFLKLVPFIIITGLFFGFYKKNNVVQPVQSLNSMKDPLYPSFAVLELFTSEGCSSCPPADDILRGVAQQDNVFALSFHVTYWNKLGWKDPFSQKMFDERQYAYGRLMQSNGVYTPQLVVNGSEEFVGSRKSQTEKSIEKGLSQKAEAGIILNKTLENNTLKVQYKIEGNYKNTVLNIALVERNIQTKVLNGENGGRTLKHDNVVRDFQTIQINATDNGTVSINLPNDFKRNDCLIIAYLQNKDTWKIVGASKTLLVKNE
jgi:hypothetical protein